MTILITTKNHKDAAMNTKLLRQKILDLAIRGKLTEQKKSDGTTRDLLKQIRDERTGEALQTRDSSTCHCEAQKRRGNLKQSKSATLKEIIPLDKSEAPFEIPENWEWVRLGDVASDFQYGSSEKSEPEGKVAVLRMSNINRMGQVVYDDLVYTSTESEIAKYTLDVGDVLFNRTNSPEWVGKTALYRGDIPAIYAGYIIRIKPKFLPEYLNYLMCSKYERDWAYEVKTDGVHQSNINAQKLMAFAVPLPPLAEQQRIVIAIENAFAEITEIENNQELLKKHIKQGRQKILDLAIRGKLTQQLKTDGTTKDLLKQISSNVILSNAKNPGKSKNEPKQIIPLDKTTAPFEIPENWEIVKYGDVVSNVSTKNYQVKTSEIKLKGSFPVVSQGQDFIDGYVDDKTKLICANENPIVLFGDHTRVVKYIDFDFVVGADGTKIIKPLKILESKYLYFATQAIVEKIEDRGYGRHFSLLSNSFLPLPPLAEQQRIVTAIENAFAEFDAMEIDLK